jgi:hypothetical protein
VLKLQPLTSLAEALSKLPALPADIADLDLAEIYLHYQPGVLRGDEASAVAVSLALRTAWSERECRRLRGIVDGQSAVLRGRKP